jgi:hypothetical protein
MHASPNLKESFLASLHHFFPFMVFFFPIQQIRQPSVVSFQLTTLYVASRFAALLVAMSSLVDRTSGEVAASAVDASEGAAVLGACSRRG